LLDPTLDPALTLVGLYHERWEQELALDELKTHQRERPVLRSQTPAGVVQEIYALMLAHYLVRVLMQEAAATQRIDPQRISFTGALRILRCRLPECVSAPGETQRWYQRLVQEIAEEILPPHRNRINPRVIKQKMSKWPKKRSHHRHPPQPKNSGSWGQLCEGYSRFLLPSRQRRVLTRCASNCSTRFAP
jgi:hypothetical protein